MVNVNCYLKEAKANKETSIIIQICYAGFRLKLYNNGSIHPNDWDRKKQRAKGAKYNHEHAELNVWLDNRVQAIRLVYRRFLNDNSRIPTKAEFKKAIDERLKNEYDHTRDMNAYILNFIERSENGTRRHGKSGKPIHKNTSKTYRAFYKHLISFSEKCKAEIMFNNIDYSFYESFITYLCQLGHSPNTLGKYIAILKTIMSESLEEGLHSNLSFRSTRFNTPREASVSISLTENELSAIIRLDLASSQVLEIVRDRFIIGCYTGLRFSDYSRLTRENITGGMLKVRTQKTGAMVVVPILDAVKQVFEKYYYELPPSISNQKTNKYLKQICAMVPELHEKIIKPTTKGSVRVVERIEKWKLVTTHTARRSFATNAYKRGVPSISIMAITGHTTEKSFMKYIKVNNTEHAEILKKRWSVSPSGRVVQTNGRLN